MWHRLRLRLLQFLTAILSPPERHVCFFCVQPLPRGEVCRCPKSAAYRLETAPPALGPEVNHKYSQHATLQCCEHCGGGPKHAIHSEPFDPRRMAEIEKIERARDAVIESAVRSVYFAEIEKTNRVRDAVIESAVRSVYAGAAQAQINAAVASAKLPLPGDYVNPISTVSISLPGNAPR